MQKLLSDMLLGVYAEFAHSVKMEVELEAHTKLVCLFSVVFMRYGS